MSKAREIVRRAASEDCFLSLQTLCEFFASTTRKGKLTPEQATAQLDDWQTVFPVVAATPTSLRLAARAFAQHNLSFWDAMQWAVAKQAGATLFLSQDMQHERELEGVRFRNPFIVPDPFSAAEPQASVAESQDRNRARTGHTDDRLTDERSRAHPRT